VRSQLNARTLGDSTHQRTDGHTLALEFTYTLDPREQARVATLVERRTRGALFWRWLGLPFLLVPFALALAFRWPFSILWPYVIVLALAAAASSLVPILRRRQAARILAEMPHLREVSYRFEETGIGLSTSVTNAAIAWAGITEATETDELFLMFVGRRFAYYVPVRVAGPRADELRRFLHLHLGERAAGVHAPNTRPVT
jgi:hypothetical protein